MPKVRTEDLLGLVRKVMPGTTSKGILTGADTIIFGNGEMTTYNDKIAVSCLFDLPPEFEGGVNGKEFETILKEITDEELEISIKENMLVMNSTSTFAEIPLKKNSQALLDLLAALDYGKLEFLTLPIDFIAGGDLCYPSVSDDYNDERFLFCMNVAGNIIQSSDGHRMSVYTMKSDSGLNVMIPKKAIPGLLAFQPTGFCDTTGWVHFQNAEDSIYSCRTVNKPFPDTGGIISAFKQEECIKLPEELLSILPGMSGLFGNDSHVVQKNIIIDINKNSLVCKFSKDGTTVKKKLRLSGNELVISFSINSIFLAEALKYTDELELAENKAMLRTDNFQHLLMLPRQS